MAGTLSAIGSLPQALHELRMLETTRRPMTTEERCSLEKRRAGLLGRLLSRVLAGPDWDDPVLEDLKTGEVECLTVRVGRLATGEARGDEGPILFCDVGGARVLCLVGQWMFDPHVVPDELGDDAEDVWFGAFSLVRAPASGIVLELAAIGDSRLRAERKVLAAGIPALPESCVLAATLDGIEAALGSTDALT